MDCGTEATARLICRSSPQPRSPTGDWNGPAAINVWDAQNGVGQAIALDPAAEASGRDAAVEAPV